MLSKVHATITNKRFLAVAISLFIAVFVVGYMLPQYRSFAEGEKAATETEQTSEDKEATIQADSDAVSESERSAEIKANSDVVRDSEKEATISAGSDEESAEAEEKDDTAEIEKKDVDEENAIVSAGEKATAVAAIKGYEVIAEVPAGAFNQDVRLQVKEAVVDKEDAINDEEDVVELTKAQVKELNRRRALGSLYLDISFVNEKGEEVEPGDELAINIKIDKELFSEDQLKQVGEINVIHLIEDEKGKIEDVETLIDDSKKEEEASEKKETKKDEVVNEIRFDKKENKVVAEFTTERFSVYAITADSFKLYFLDKGNINNENFGAPLAMMPSYDTANNWLVGLDYDNQTYTVQPNGQNWQHQTTHDIKVPFGFTFDKAVSLRNYQDTSNNLEWRTNENNGQIVGTVNAIRVGAGWEMRKINSSNFESTQYTNTSNNQDRLTDFAAIYKRQSLSELPFYVVNKGTTNPIETITNVINNDLFKINGATENDSTNKYSIGLGEVLTFAGNDYSTITKNGIEYTYVSSYIVDDEGTRTPIKALRYEGGTHLWYYSTTNRDARNANEMTVLTNDYNVFIEYVAADPDAGRYKGTFHVLDKDVTDSTYGYRQLKEQEFVGRDYYEIDLSTTDGKYIEKNASGNVVSTKSLYEYFGMDPSEHNYVSARIRHGNSGSVEGNNTNRVLKVECIDGAMWLTMEGGGRQILSNKNLYVLFEDPIELEKAPTIDSTSMGFHVHMFNFPKSAFDNPVSGVNGGAAIGRWASEYRKAFGYDESAGDSRGAFSGDKYEGQTERGLYSRNTKGTGSYETMFPDVLHAWNSSSYKDYTNVSLSNWFDPKTSQFHVGEANHLFLKNVYDKSGYIYYNSEENAAVLNNAGSDGLMDFDVYKALASPVYTSNGGKQYGPGSFFYHRGNFMPFNDIDTTKRYATNKYDADGAEWANSTHTGQVNDDPNHVQTNTDQADPNHNNVTVYGLKNGRVSGQNTKNPDYFHGMYAYMNFFQPANGLVKNPESQNMENMVYEFTGDDDMMVYIDGVLVLDLGGVHDAESGKINFATGEVTYTMNGSYTPSGTTNRAARLRNGTPTTIKAEFEKAGKASGVLWDGNTFENDSFHTIQIFYMERGEGASNLKIKVNIPPVPDSSFTVQKKVNKQNGQPDSAADPDEEFTVKLEYKDTDGTWKSLGAYRNTDNEPAKYYIQGKETFDTNGNINLTSLGADGKIKLKDGERAIFPGLTRINPNEQKISIRATEITSSRLQAPAGNGSNVDDIYQVDYFATRDGLKDEVDGNIIQVSIPQNQTAGVLVENTPSALAITKNLQDSAASQSSEVFKVKVKLTMNEGHRHLVDSGRTFPVVVKDAAGNVVENSLTSVTFTYSGSSGVNTSPEMEIKHGQTIHIYNLPKEATYEVIESDTKGRLPIYDSNKTGNLWVVDGDKRNATSASTTIINKPVELTKVSALSDDNKLGNATFKLYKAQFDRWDSHLQREGLTKPEFFALDDWSRFDKSGYDLDIHANGAAVTWANNTSDGNGKIVLPITEPGQYLLFEETPPTGYERMKAPWIIVVGEDGDVQVWYNKAPNYVKKGGPGSTTNTDESPVVTNRWWPAYNYVKSGNLNLKNVPKPVKIKKTKTGKETGLEGAEFILGDLGDKANGNNISNKNDYIHGTSNGIVKDADNNTMVIVSEDDGTIDLTDVINRLTGTNGQISKGYSIENGKKAFLLYETKAPVGHKLAMKPWMIIIDQDRNVTVREYNGSNSDYENRLKNNTLTDGTYWTFNWLKSGYSTDQPNNNLGNEPQKLRKVDSENTSTGLANVEFKIYRAKWQNANKNHLQKDYEIVGEFKSDANGYIDISELYKNLGTSGLISEVTPFLIYETKNPNVGYSAPKAPWYMAINNSTKEYRVYYYSDPNKEFSDTDWIPFNGFVGCWSYSESYITNTKHTGELYKLDIDSKEAIEGVEFKLFPTCYKSTGSGYSYNYSYDTNFIQKCGTATDVVSDKDGKLSLGRLVHSGYYLLYETKQGTGYVRPSLPWIIKVDGGKVSAVKKCRGDKETTYSNFTDSTFFDVRHFENIQKLNDNFVIYNQKVYELPKTGGPGTQMFTFFGLTIMALATAIIFRARKEEEA